MSAAIRQVRVRYEGTVQGVGFRYTVHRLAGDLGVAGRAENRPDGSVRLLAEGPEDILKQLLLRIRVSRLGGGIEREQIEWGPAEGLTGFQIR